jgi:hypothetical protein
MRNYPRSLALMDVSSYMRLDSREVSLSGPDQVLVQTFCLLDGLGHKTKEGVLELARAALAA